MCYKAVLKRYSAQQRIKKMDDEQFAQRYRRWHARMSYAKSSVRIIACVGALIDSTNAVWILASGLLLAEILGIAEELI